MSIVSTLSRESAFVHDLGVLVSITSIISIISTAVAPNPIGWRGDSHSGYPPLSIQIIRNKLNLWLNLGLNLPIGHYYSCSTSKGTFITFKNCQDMRFLFRFSSVEVFAPYGRIDIRFYYILFPQFIRNNHDTKRVIGFKTRHNR